MIAACRRAGEDIKALSADGAIRGDQILRDSSAADPDDDRRGGMRPA